MKQRLFGAVLMMNKIKLPKTIMPKLKNTYELKN